MANTAAAGLMENPGLARNAEPVTIRAVESKRDLATFIALPRQLYRGMPGFVAPLDFERKTLFDRKSAAFFKHGQAAYFMAWRGGKPVGRISAQTDPVAIETWGAAIGLFGALDAIDDPAVTQALLAAAEDWLRAAGMARIRGPYTLNANGESGLMVSGQLASQMTAMPWHPPYLARHMAELGWPKAMDLLAYELEVGPEVEKKLAVPRGKGGVTLREMRPKQMAEDAEILRQIYNDAWAENWGFVPITPAEIQAMVKEMKPVLKPGHYILVEHGGAPVAVALLVPNLFDIIGDLDGAPSPAGWVKFAYRLLTGKFRSGRVIVLGVKRELRNTTLGAVIPSLIIKELMLRGRGTPYKTVELSWILETNTRIRRLIEQLVPAPYKVFRLYERALPGAEAGKR